MKINNDEKKIIVKNLKKNPLYKYLKEIQLGPINYLIANDFEYDKISELINNSKNINYNYDCFVDENKKNNDPNTKTNFKFLGYFSLDSHKKELIYIGKGYKFHIELSKIDLKKEDSDILETPFYAIVTLETITIKDKNYINYEVINLEFVESINFDLKDYQELRSNYSTKEWFDLVITTLGYNPNKFTMFEKFNFLLRLIPYCTNNYNYIELGNKETGKSFFFDSLSERHSALIAADNLSFADLVYNNQSNSYGLIKTLKVIAIDEIVDVNFKNKDVITALQSYLGDGTISRNSLKISGDASVVLLGNINNVESLLSSSSYLFNEFKTKIDNETFFDKFYYFSPTWKTNKIDSDNYCDDSEERLSLDFFINSLTKLRTEDSYFVNIIDKHLEIDLTNSVRDKRIKRTIAGLLKILHPDGKVTPEELETYAYIALAGRKLILDQLHIKSENQYVNTLSISSKISNLDITSNNYYNSCILLSEKLFSEFDLNLSDIEYYYHDYSYFDRSNFNEVKNDTTDNITKTIEVNANIINKKLGFELIEPRIAVKFKADNHIYKLALSTYGINANIIEYDEDQKNKNNDIDFLNKAFTLIKSKNYNKPSTVHKLRYYTNIFWDDLKEKNKDNLAMITLIDIIESTNKNLLSLFDENIELKNKIENLEKEIKKNNESLEIELKKTNENLETELKKSNDLVKKLEGDFNRHKHILKEYPNSYSVEDIYIPQSFSINNFGSFGKSLFGSNKFKNDSQPYSNNLTVFDFGKIQKLKAEYLKEIKNKNK